MSPAQGQPVVGLGPGGGQRRLDHVQAVHVRLAGGVLIRPHPPPRDELGDVPDAARAAAAEEVRVERHHHVGNPRVLVKVVKPVVGVERFAVSRHRGAVGGVAGQRLVLVPFRLGKFLEDAFDDLIAERRRHDGLGQQAQPGAAARPLPVEGAAQGGEGVVPGGGLAEAGDVLGAIRVVQGQHGGLMVGVGRPQAGGVLRVALDLGRPAEVAFGQQADADAAQRHGGGEEQRLAGNDFFRRPDVGLQGDRRGRPDRAAADAGQGQRRPHQGQELPPAQGAGPAGRLFRKFPMNQLPKGRRVGQLFQGTPVLLPLGAPQAILEFGEFGRQVLARVHRWHVVHEVRYRAS